MPSSRRSSRGSAASSRRSTQSKSSKSSNRSASKGRSSKTPNAKTKKPRTTPKTAKKKAKITAAYDAKTLSDLRKNIDKLAKKFKVDIFEVDEDNAKDIHAELRKGGRARILSQGKLRADFIYNYFSCKNGNYLTGSTQMDGEKPEARHYQQKKGSNFWWSGLKIFALREKAGDKLLAGFVVMHNAYLSMYPGSDESHYDVDPVMKAGKTNIAKDIGNDRLGSHIWADVPILCGSGYGDLLISIAMVECGMKKLLVSVAEGEDNEAMIALLERWGYKQLVMTHPKTKEPWEDEDGESLYVMYRGDSLKPGEITERAKGPEDSNKSDKKNGDSKSKPKAKKATMKEMKEKSKDKYDRLKATHTVSLAKKDTTLGKLKDQLKEKDALIAELKAKSKLLKAQMKTVRSRFLSVVKSSLDNVMSEDPSKPSKKTKKKPSKSAAPMEEEEETAPPSRARKSSGGRKRKGASSSSTPARTPSRKSSASSRKKLRRSSRK